MTRYEARRLAQQHWPAWRVQITVTLATTILTYNWRVQAATIEAAIKTGFGKVRAEMRDDKTSGRSHWQGASVAVSPIDLTPTSRYRPIQRSLTCLL